MLSARVFERQLILNISLYLFIMTASVYMVDGEMRVNSATTGSHPGD